MVAEREARLLLTTKDDGNTSKLFTGLAKTSGNLSLNLEKTSEGFSNIGENIPTKSLKGFNKTSKNSAVSARKLGQSFRGVGSNFNSLIDTTEKANGIFEATDNTFLKLGATLTGNKAKLNLLNSVVGPAGNFWQKYSKASTGAGKSLVLLKTASKALVPILSQTADLSGDAAKKLESMGGAVSHLAKPLSLVSEKLGKTKKGLRLAGVASEINDIVENLKDFKDETIPEIREQLEGTLETVEKLGLKEKFFGSTFKSLNTAATVLSATTKGLTKQTSDLFLGFVKFTEIQSYVSVVANGLIEVKRTMSGVYQATEDLQSIGVDTTFQESAIAVGLFGEKLLFSTEAAKKFRTEALSAFVQLQDQLAYLTTLSAAAEKGQQKLGKSINDLVNGPLKNAISSMDVAVGYYDAISAGQESLDFMNASMKFSVATGAAAADSIGVLAQTHNIYRLNARDATKTAALFNATIENGVVNGQQLASGMGQLASVAKDAGIDLVELNAMFASLTKNGFNATDAFQGLMSLISSIAGQGSESAKAAQELGIRFDFARVKAEGLVSPINELYSAANGSSSKIKTIIPDALGYRTAMALATSASEDFITTQAKMENLDNGSLDTVFERRRDSILQRSEALKNGFQQEMIAFGDSMKESMEPALAASEKVLEKFRNLPGFAKNAILMTTQVSRNIDKVSKSANILISSVSGIAQAFVMAKAAGLLFTAAGRERLRLIIDLVKNQKQYTKALQTFLGISDGVRESIGNMTGLERTQLGMSKKLLKSRQLAAKSLEKITGDNQVNFFKTTPGQVKKTVNEAFANATPVIKNRANDLRSLIQDQFVDLKKGGKGSIITKELGLDKVEDSEKELDKALGRIGKRREQGFRGIPTAEKEAYTERLDLMETNIKKRQELMAMSNKQLALEQAGIASAQNRITAASKTVKGTLEQGKGLIEQTVANKAQMLTEIRRSTASQLRQINDDIANQIQNLAPEFAEQLAGKTGAELDEALFQVRDNIDIDDESIDKLASTVDSKKQVENTSQEQVKSLQNESKVLRDATKSRHLDAVSREKALELIGQETEARTASIEKLQENTKIDFLEIIGEDDIKARLGAGFDTASEEMQEQVATLAEELQESSEEIFESEEASSILDAIGLGEVGGSIEELEGVGAKLEEIRELGEADPEAIALVERNLGQRRQLTEITTAQTAALRLQNASLAEYTAVVGASSLADAKAIGFKGPLAGANVWLTASYLNVKAAILGNTVAQEAQVGSTWLSITAAKAKVVMDGIMTGTTNLLSLAVNGLNTAVASLWLALGPVGVAIIAVVGGIALLWKSLQRKKEIEEFAEGFDKIAEASDSFTKNLEDAKKLNEFASDLRDLKTDLTATAEAAEKTGDKTNFARKSLDALDDTGAESLEKTGKQYDTLRKVTLSGFIDGLDKTSSSMVSFNAANKKAFDHTIINNSIESSKIMAQEFRDLAIQAREAGEAILAIRYDHLAEQQDEVGDIGDNFQKNFEDSLNEEELKEYQEAVEKKERKKRNFDARVLRKRGAVLVEDNRILAGMKGHEVQDILKDRKHDKIGTAVDKAVARGKERLLSVQAEIEAMESGELLSSKGKTKKQKDDGVLSTSEKILANHKKDGSQLALNAESFKEMQQAEKDLLDERSAGVDLDIENVQTQLDQGIEKEKLTHQEQKDLQDLIGSLKEENSEREKAFKLQVKNQKEAQATLAAIDSNDAATSITKLNEQIYTAKVRVLQESATEAEKAANHEYFEKIKDDATEILNMPAELRNASVAAFEGLSGTLTGSMNTTSTNQRRQLSIAINDIAAFSTNATNVTEKGLEASRQAANKAMESVDNVVAAGGVTAEIAEQMYTQILEQESHVTLTNGQGVIQRAADIEAGQERIIQAYQNAANKRVKINEVAIAKINHLHATGSLTAFEAEEDRFEMQIKNNKMLFESATENYDRLVEFFGESDQRAIDGLNAKIEAEQAYKRVKFDSARAEEERALWGAERQVKINQEWIAEVALLESTSNFTARQAEEERMAREVENNEILLEVATERYDNIAKARGADSDEALAQYDKMLAADRTLFQSQFTEKRAAKERALYDAKREVELRKEVLNDIALLESTARMTSFEAEEEKMQVEVDRHQILLDIAAQRYENISQNSVEGSRETLDAYAELLAAERAFDQSEFAQHRAEEMRQVALETSSVNIEVIKTNFAYQKQIDTIQLIAEELDRKQRFAQAYNETLQQSITFFDNISNLAMQSVKNEHTKAAIGGEIAKRNLRVMKIAQKREQDSLTAQTLSNELAASNAITQNKIAIAEKDQQITLAEINFEQEKRNKLLREDEIQLKELKIQQLNRERELLGQTGTKLNANLETERKIAAQNQTQLDLNQEQAKNGGVLDILNRKMEEMASKYDRQKEVNANITNSLNSRLGFTTNMLGLAGQLTADEHQQQKIAQIAARTKLKLLSQQQAMEQRMLEIQQAQEKSLLVQEKIKLRLLASQQKIAIAEDTKKLQEARAAGDTEAVQQITDVLDSRYSALSVIESSTKELTKQQRIQKDLARAQRQDLKLKQKSEKFSAEAEVINTAPEDTESHKKRKENLRKRLLREVLGEVGLNVGNVDNNNFSSTTAKLPNNTGFNTPDEVDVKTIFQEGVNDAFLDNGLDITNKHPEEFSQINKAIDGSSTTKNKSIFNQMDPQQLDHWKSLFGYSPNKDSQSTPVTITNTPEIKSDVEPPTPEQDALPTNLVDLNQAQLEVQKELVRVLRGDKTEGEDVTNKDKEGVSKKIEMHNEIHLTVSQGEGDEDIETTVLGALESFVSQAEAGVADQF